MESFRKFWRWLFPEKPAHTTKEIEALRLDFKERYQNFQRLIRANNRALETMADIDQTLQGEHPFGMTFVRSRCTSVSVSVYKMVRKIQLLAPDKYNELFGRFDQIKAQIDQVLDVRSSPRDQRLVIRLVDINKDMIDLVGSKMANLGELKNNVKINVPGGFVITATAFQRFVEHNELTSEVNRRFQSVDLADMEKLYTLSAEIQQLIFKAEIPKDLEDAIMDDWWHTEEEAGFEITTALRSSAIGEDEAGSTFAGMHLSELNISAEHVLDAYREIVASKYSLPAITYRLKKGFKDEDIVMCVGCLVMIDAVAGGVIYSRNPSNAHDDSIFINSAWGLPKAVVEGLIDCDHFVVSRDKPPEIIHEDVRDKDKKFVCYPLEGVCRLDLSGEDRTLPSIDHEQVKRLTELAIKIEDNYAVPQDIEWAIDYDGTIYILQCRPLQQKESMTFSIPEALRGQYYEAVIVKGGVTASPGTACGRAFLINREADILSFPDGFVLVTQLALPGWASLLNRCAGIITERGGVAGHLASVAREFGIPALFGVSGVKERLCNGDLITLDASGRTIYRGRIESLISAPEVKKNLMEGSPVYEILRKLSNFILPLNLLDPDSPEFKPANCRTLQDITRFVHEKSVREMFSFGKEHTFSERAGKQLYYHVPMKWWILNLDDGFKEEVKGKYVRLENIASVPMLAFWEGLTTIPWEGPPAIDGKGLMSVMFRSTSNTSLIVGRRSAFADQNYFMISKNFCNLSSRLGYHFSTMEAYVTDRPEENYIKFQFKGGAADYKRRLQRVLFIKNLLEEFGFRVKITDDNLVSRLDRREHNFMIQRLVILGYLSIHTRQIDMIMTNRAAINHYRAKYKKDIDFLIYKHQPQFLVDR